MLEGTPTRYLLVSGIAAGGLSPLVVSIQALTREGFNLAIHPLSMLSLGDFGWVQITNFILSGLLFIAFAVGLRRALTAGRGRLLGPLLIGFYGVSLIAAGVFTVDPMLGFPPGSPEGLPETLSWHAQLHNLIFLLAFIGIIAAQFVYARRFASTKRWGFAVYCLATGVATPALIVLSQAATAITGYLLFGAGIVVNLWVILFAARMLAEYGSRKPTRSGQPGPNASAPASPASQPNVVSNIPSSTS